MEKILEQEVVANFMALYQHIPVRAEENTKCYDRINSNPDTSEYKVRVLTIQHLVSYRNVL